MRVFFSETALENKNIKINPSKHSQEIVNSTSLATETKLITHPVLEGELPAPEVHLMLNTKGTLNTPKSTGLVLKAVNDIENQFWNYQLIEREESIIIISLYYLQKLLRF